MKTATYELDYADPMAFNFCLATIYAAHATGAEIVEVHTTQEDTVRITFDREVSQALIIDILALIIETRKD